MSRRKRNDQPEFPAPEESAATATATAEPEAPEAAEATPGAPANGDGASQAADPGGQAAPPDPLRAAFQAGRNDEFIARLKDIHRRKLEAKAEVADAAKDLKAAKARLQSIQDDEDKLLAAYLYNTMPLYDPPAANGRAKDAAAEAPAPAETWRAVPIREALAGLPASVYVRLEEAEISTMGGYADFCERNASKVDSGEHPVRKIKGIGPAKVEQIQAAEEAFWQRWKAAPAADVDVDAGAGDDPDWYLRPVSALGLPSGVNASLAGAGLVNLGDLAQRLKDKGTVEDLPGLSGFLGASVKRRFEEYQAGEETEEPEDGDTEDEEANHA